VTEVGVQELHDHLSRILRRVAAGEDVVVTNRGRRVAWLSALDERSGLDRLVAEGLARPPREAATPVDPAELVTPAGGSVSELIDRDPR